MNQRNKIKSTGEQFKAPVSKELNQLKQENKELRDELSKKSKIQPLRIVTKYNLTQALKMFSKDEFDVADWWTDGITIGFTTKDGIKKDVLISELAPL